MTVNSDLDVFLVRHQDTSDTLWASQVDDLAATVTRWTGNDTRIVDYTIEDLRAASAEPMVRDVVEQGLTVAGSRPWLLKQLRTVPKKARSR